VGVKVGVRLSASQSAARPLTQYGRFKARSDAFDHKVGVGVENRAGRVSVRMDGICEAGSARRVAINSGVSAAAIANDQALWICSAADDGAVAAWAVAIDLRNARP
jgi:type IV secretory pathway TrbD component